MGAVHTIGDFIRSVFPTIVNKNGSLFKALLADKESEDGTIETIFEDIEKTRKEWSEQSIYQQSGEQLKRTLSVFSIIKQLQNESEQTFKNRNKLLFMRGSDTLWGNRRDILNIFTTIKMYILLITQNLLRITFSQTVILKTRMRGSLSMLFMSVKRDLKKQPVSFLMQREYVVSV